MVGEWLVFFIVVVFMFCNAVEQSVALEKYQISLFSTLSFFPPCTVFAFFHVARSIFLKTGQKEFCCSIKIISKHMKMKILFFKCS